MNKKSFRLLIGTMIAGTLLTTSCKKEEVAPPIENKPTIVGAKEVTKTSFIEKNETWYADSIYFLQGKVIVKEGVTLKIQPGTIIKGKAGVATMASALIISRGAKIDAQGTPEKPIIFTSEFDNIKTGELKGTNLSKYDNQKWGGLIILGKSLISAGKGDTQTSIEGIPADEEYGQYGGDNLYDNSGILTYVSIRHNGAIIKENTEINGLTLGGVGNGTKIENIEVYATSDDGIECFGGSVDLTNILVYYQGDDGIDIDQNYSGKIENFMVIQGEIAGGTDKGLEIDGPEGTTNKLGLFTLKNGILRSEDTKGIPADFKDKAQGKIENVTFEYEKAQSKEIRIRANFDKNNSCSTLPDSYSNLTDNLPKLTFNENKLNSCKGVVYNAITEKDNLGNLICNNLTAADQNIVENKITNGSGSNLDISIFNWTIAKNNGEL
jgi:hypothetical protein